MKKILLTILILTSIMTNSLTQETAFKIFSYSEFMELLENEEDSIFYLKDALIKLDYRTDQEFFFEIEDMPPSENQDELKIIDKEIRLENVHFQAEDYILGQGLHHLIFKKPVNLYEVGSALFSNCIFESTVSVNQSKLSELGVEKISLLTQTGMNAFTFSNSIFNKGLKLSSIELDSRITLWVNIKNCEIHPEDSERFFKIRFQNIEIGKFISNEIHGFNKSELRFINIDQLVVSENTFISDEVTIFMEKLESAGKIVMYNNSFPEKTFMELGEINHNAMIQWNQFENKLYNNIGRQAFFDSHNLNIMEIFEVRDSLTACYLENAFIESELFYKQETKLTGQFVDLYNSQHSKREANQAFIALKNLETKRAKYLYEQDPGFTNYFQWKINSFLKVFSDYGTRPAKAVVFSLYVILIFGTFYLFTPNAWDTLNRNRLINRIRFFTKYFRERDGIKEIYEDRKKDEIMNYKEFRAYMNESRMEVPYFFLLLAKPLYIFTLSGNKSKNLLLDKLDLLKGRWIELKPTRKIITGGLISIWLLILIMYDLIVKILNAMILSINTFTTLGFGEIPIRGLARYLAIIQGFIGWFMLSLFSVSLISQLMQ